MTEPTRKLNTEKLNVDLAEKVLNLVENDPDSHYQGSWLSECGTTACIAGHTMLASGEYVRRRQETGRFCLVHRKTGDIVSAEREGARLLGLDPDTANEIFMDMDEDQAVAKLRHLVHEAKRDQHHHTHEGAPS